jgi:hypothetical protein
MLDPFGDRFAAPNKPAAYGVRRARFTGDE